MYLQEIYDAAKVAEGEIIHLTTTLAREKGLTIEDCFTHFDIHGKGSVSTKEFIEGLRMLGIDIPDNVGSLITSKIPLNSSGKIGVKQFQMFCEARQHPEQESFLGPTLAGESSEGQYTAGPNQAVTVDKGAVMRFGGETWQGGKQKPYESQVHPQILETAYENLSKLEDKDMRDFGRRGPRRKQKRKVPQLVDPSTKPDMRDFIKDDALKKQMHEFPVNLLSDLSAPKRRRILEQISRMSNKPRGGESKKRKPDKPTKNDLVVRYMNFLADRGWEKALKRVNKQLFHSRGKSHTSCSPSLFTPPAAIEQGTFEQTDDRYWGDATERLEDRNDETISSFEPETVALAEASSGLTLNNKGQKWFAPETFEFADGSTILFKILKGPKVRKGTKLPYVSPRIPDILYIPEMYEDMQSIKTDFQEMLENLPGSRLLIIHYPGMAGTGWSNYPPDDDSKQEYEKYSPQRKELTTTRIASYVYQLIIHLRDEKRWGPSEVQSESIRKKQAKRGHLGRDIIFIGCGMGGQVATILSSEFVCKRSVKKGYYLWKQDRIFASSLRQIIILNMPLRPDADLTSVLERLSNAHEQVSSAAGIGDDFKFELNVKGSFSGGKPRNRRTQFLDKTKELAQENSPSKGFTDEKNRQLYEKLNIKTAAMSLYSSMQKRPSSQAQDEWRKLRPDTMDGQIDWDAVAPLRSELFRLISSALFSKEYINSVGTAVALAELFSRNVSLRQFDPFLDYGLACLAKGLSTSPDLSKMVTELPVPVLEVTSTSDAFVMPVNALETAFYRYNASMDEGNKVLWDVFIRERLYESETFESFLKYAGHPLPRVVQDTYLDSPENSEEFEDDSSMDEKEADLGKSVAARLRQPTRRLPDGSIIRVKHDNEELKLIRRKPVHIVWLKAGHLIFQERRKHVMSIIYQSVCGHQGDQAYGIWRKTPYHTSKHRMTFSSSVAIQDSSISQDVLTQSSSVDKLGNEWIYEELEKRALPTHGSVLELMQRLERHIDGEIRISSNKNASTEDFRIQQLRKVERKERWRKQTTREIKRSKWGKQATEEEINKHLEYLWSCLEAERESMAVEDKRARSIRKRENEEEQARKTAEDNKKRYEMASQLVGDTSETADKTKLVEHMTSQNMAVARYYNRKKILMKWTETTSELHDDIDANRPSSKLANISPSDVKILSLPNEKYGYGLNSTNVAEVTKGAYRLIEDAAVTRSRKELSVTSWNQAKVDSNNLKQDIRQATASLKRSRRALNAALQEKDRVIKVLQGKGIDHGKDPFVRQLIDEAHEHEQSIKIDERKLEAAKSQRVVASQTLAPLEKYGTALCNMDKHKGEELSRMRVKLSQMLFDRRKLRRTELQLQENTEKEINNLHKDKTVAKNTLRKLNDEYKRLRFTRAGGHKKKPKFVNVRYFHGGISQRVERKPFRQLLLTDAKKTSEKITEMTKQYSLKQKVLATATANLNIVEGDIRMLKEALYEVTQQIKRNQLDDVETSHQEKEAPESTAVVKKNKAAPNDWFSEALLAMNKTISVYDMIEENDDVTGSFMLVDEEEEPYAIEQQSAERINRAYLTLSRWKPHYERTLEEKQWIGIDMAIHPWWFTNIPEDERNALQSDKDYQTSLNASQLIRLKGYPLSVNVSTSRFSCIEDINLFLVFKKYYYGQPEVSEQIRDKFTSGRIYGISAIARGLLARSKIPLMRSNEEQDWVSLDKVLRPELYSDEEDLSEGESDSENSNNEDVASSQQASLPDEESTDEGPVNKYRAKPGTARHERGRRNFKGMFRKLMSWTFKRNQPPSKPKTKPRNTRKKGASAKEESGPKTKRTPEDERRAHYRRGESGFIGTCYSREDLLTILETPTADLTSICDVKAQALLRAYGSDGGKALAKYGHRLHTYVAKDISQVAEYLKKRQEDLQREKCIDYTPFLAFSDADGDRQNVAFVACMQAQGSVLVRSGEAERLLQVNSATLQADTTVDHIFDVPGHASNCVAYGPRDWPSIHGDVEEVSEPDKETGVQLQYDWLSADAKKRVLSATLRRQNMTQQYTHEDGWEDISQADAWGDLPSTRGSIVFRDQGHTLRGRPSRASTTGTFTDSNSHLAATKTATTPVGPVKVHRSLGNEDGTAEHLLLIHHHLPSRLQPFHVISGQGRGNISAKATEKNESDFQHVFDDLENIGVGPINWALYGTKPAPLEIREAAELPIQDREIEISRAKSARDAAAMEVEDTEEKLVNQYEKECFLPGVQPLCVGMTVTVTFSGSFETKERNYLPGRCEVYLYRNSCLSLGDIEEYPGEVKVPRGRDSHTPVVRSRYSTVRRPSTASEVGYHSTQEQADFQEFQENTADIYESTKANPLISLSRQEQFACLHPSDCDVKQSSVVSDSTAFEIVPGAFPLNTVAHGTFYDKNSARFPSEHAPNLAKSFPDAFNVPPEQMVSQMRVPVGHSVAELCSPNNKGEIGKVVLKHEPGSGPIVPGKYCVSVKGRSPGTYSVSVDGIMAYSLRDYLEGLKRKQKYREKRIPQCRTELIDCQTSIRLGIRKKELVCQLLLRSEKEMSLLSQKIAKLRQALEVMHVTRGDLGSDAEDSDLDVDDYESKKFPVADTDNGHSSSSEEDNEDDSTESEQASSSESSYNSFEERNEKNQRANLRRRNKITKNELQQDLPVVPKVRAIVLRQLEKVEERFAKKVRALHSREEELSQIKDGLEALRQAEKDHEQELNHLRHEEFRVRKHLRNCVQKLGEHFGGDATKIPVSAPQPDGQNLEETLRRQDKHLQEKDKSSARSDVVTVQSEQGAVKLLCEDLATVADEDLRYLRLGPQLHEWLNQEIEKEKKDPENVKLTPADRVRRKKLHDLSLAEKAWISLDRTINPDLHFILEDSDDENEEGGTHPGKAVDIKQNAKGAYVLAAQWLTNEDEKTDIDKFLDKHPLRSPQNKIQKETEGEHGKILPPENIDFENESEQDGSESDSDDSEYGFLWKKQGNVVGEPKVSDDKIPACPYKRVDLLRIKNMPMAYLSKSERKVRKLLNRFHDRKPKEIRIRRRVKRSKKMDFIASINSHPNMSIPHNTEQPDHSNNEPAMEESKDDDSYTVISFDVEDPDEVELDEQHDPDAHLSREEKLAKMLKEIRQDDDDDEKHSKFRPKRIHVENIEFHESASRFLRVYSAVPIPKYASKQLSELLHIKRNAILHRWSADIRHASEVRKKGIRDMMLARVYSLKQSDVDIKGLDQALQEQLEQLDDEIEVTDVDERCRELLREIDRVLSSPQETMDTLVLHGAEQRFDRDILLLELERALDRELLKQVFERENIEQAIVSEQLREHAEQQRKIALEKQEQLKEERKQAMRSLEEEERKKAAQLLERVENRMKAKVHLNEAEKLEQRDLKKQAQALLDQQQKLKEELEEKDIMFDNHKSATHDWEIDLERLRFDPNDPLNELGPMAQWGDPDKPLTPRKQVEIRMEEMRKKEKARKEALQASQGSTEGNFGFISTANRQRKLELQSQIFKGKTQGAKVNLPPWKPCIPVEALRERLTEVEHEFTRIRTHEKRANFVRSSVLLSYLRGGPIRVSYIDAIFELSYEIQELKNYLRLNILDRELHRAYSTTAEQFTTDALHGYPQTMVRLPAIDAMERDSNRIIARQIANGLVNDVLNYMQEGWVFGEQESSLYAAGFVPSLKKDAPLRPFESASDAARQFTLIGAEAKAKVMNAIRGLKGLFGQPNTNIQATMLYQQTDPTGSLLPEAASVSPEKFLRSEDSNETSCNHLEGQTAPAYSTTRQKDHQLVPYQKAGKLPKIIELIRADKNSKGKAGLTGGDGRIPDHERWKPKVIATKAKQTFNMASQAKHKALHTMDSTEHTLKYGMFLLSLMYFKCMSQLQKQKDLWGGSRVLNYMKGKSMFDEDMTEERKKLVAASKARKERLRVLALVYDKANKGFEAISQRKQAERRSIQIRKAARERDIVKRKKAAIEIQRCYRGWRSRLSVFKEIKARVEKLQRVQLERVAATAIQAICRGYLAREYVNIKRKELEAFTRKVRQEEDLDLEAAYFKQNKLQNMRRKLTQKVESKTKARKEMDKRIEKNLDSVDDDPLMQNPDIEESLMMEKLEKEQREGLIDKSTDRNEGNVNVAKLLKMGYDPYFFHVAHPVEREQMKERFHGVSDVSHVSSSSMDKEIIAAAKAAEEMRAKARSNKSRKHLVEKFDREADVASQVIESANSLPSIRGLRLPKGKKANDELQHTFLQGDE